MLSMIRPSVCSKFARLATATRVITSAPHSRTTDVSCATTRINRLTQQKHPSRVWIETPRHEQFGTLSTEQVFRVSECLSYGLFSSLLFMTSERSVVAPIPATVVHRSSHHTRRSSTVPILVGVTCQKLGQPHSRVCVLNPLPLLIQSSRPLTVAAKPLEILAAEAIRTIRADGRKEESGTETEHEDSH